MVLVGGHTIARAGRGVKAMAIAGWNTGVTLNRSPGANVSSLNPCIGIACATSGPGLKCNYHCRHIRRYPVTSVGVRDLKQKTSQVLRRVREKKERIQITHRGVVVALLVPVPSRRSPAQEKRD